MKNKKIFIILIFVLTIIICVLLFLLHKKNDMKIDISGVDEINDYMDILENNFKKNNIKYKVEKSKNDNIYSMLITIDGKERSYISYNIDLETKENLSNEEIASQFGYSLQDIYYKIDDRLKKYYKEEIDIGWVESNECDFECYKSFYRNIESLSDSCNLYVKNNKLYIYISFDSNSPAGDKEYFDNLKYDIYEIEV